MTASPSSLIEALEPVCGPDGVIASPEELLVYECDGYTIDRQAPDVVVLPTTTEMTAAVVRACRQHDVPMVVRGAGTSLTGGTVAVGGGAMIATTRMKRILEVHPRDRYAVVQPGVVNLALTEHLRGTGYHFAPDPSSQGACTIGGNVAVNSGGPHTLKYGVTASHVLGLTLVLPDGEIVRTGGVTEDVAGYDLTGLIVGSEGTFGIITEIVVRLTRDPASHRTLLAVFASVDDACQTVSDIIGEGIIPAAMEMMDREIIQAVEAAFQFGFPQDAAAVTIIELDGPDAGLDAEAERIVAMCRAHGADDVRRASSEAERQLLWKSRKKAFGALGRLSPSYMTQDGVVPRTRLPEMLREVRRIATERGVRIANVFHAGDGNIHPVSLFDERDRAEVQRVHQAGREILETCIRLGGSVSGEHGVGIEKNAFMPLMFSADDLATMRRVRRVFDPDDAIGRGKIFADSVEAPGHG